MTTVSLRPRVVHDPPEGSAAGLGDLWVAVTEAGGAVDFVPGWPEREIRDLAATTIDEVRDGRVHMLVLGDDAARPDGTVFLRPGSGIAAHTATVQRLMVHPELQGGGRGGALLDAVVVLGQDLGLELLTLGARGGTSLPEFYAVHGWELTGVLPRGVRLAPDDTRDVHLFHRDVGRPIV